MWINDGPISNRISTATRLGGETVGDRVDREVSAREVTLNSREEGDLIGAAGVTTDAVSPKGRDLAHYRVPSWNTNGTESILIGGVGKEGTQLVWSGLCGKIPICWGSPSDHIADGTTNNIGAKSCRPQRAQQISNVARDSGAHRRRGGHAPLAAALSEIKRKSRHAE